MSFTGWSLLVGFLLVSMVLLGTLVERLPLSSAMVYLLLGAIIAPTDPVLVAGMHAEPGTGPDRLGFSLAGEGGLNDGAALPFVMLGPGLLGVHDLGPGLSRWWSLDLLWSTAGGIASGGAIGALTGWLVVCLRVHHPDAVGLDVFLGIGLIALACGVAQLMLASGFLAVFASGLAWQRVREQPQAAARPLGTPTHG